MVDSSAKVQTYLTLGEPGGERSNGQCMRRSRFFSSKRGGEGVQAQRQENSLDFFMFVLGFFSPKFSGDAGGSNYSRGGSKC